MKLRLMDRQTRFDMEDAAAGAAQEAARICAILHTSMDAVLKYVHPVLQPEWLEHARKEFDKHDLELDPGWPAVW